ncbi:MAG: hypothetical protein ACREO5_11055, partial [Candidatus Binatia bacterium]
MIDSCLPSSECLVKPVLRTRYGLTGGTVRLFIRTCKEGLNIDMVAPGMERKLKLGIAGIGVGPSG